MTVHTATIKHFTTTGKLDDTTILTGSLEEIAEQAWPIAPCRDNKSEFCYEWGDDIWLWWDGLEDRDLEDPDLENTKGLTWDESNEEWLHTTKPEATIGNVSAYLSHILDVHLNHIQITENPRP